MTRLRLGIKNIRVSFILVATIILIMFCGCKKQKVDLKDLADLGAHDFLTSTAKKTWPSDMRNIGNRAQTALTKLENGTIDTEPILLMAIISLIDLDNQPILDIAFFDENKDLRGLRIKERYIESDGSITTLKEDYPVFVNTLDTVIAMNVYFPIHIREKNQHKDKQLWLEYVNRNLDDLIRLNIDERQHGSSDTHLKGMPFEKTPPIYISIPDPNRVHVEMSIYDREGNESDSIELLNGMPMEFYENQTQ